MAHALTLPEISEPIRVLAADNTRMNSQLLASALERDKRFQVLEPVSESAAIMAAVSAEQPTVVVLSVPLDNHPRKGFEVARDLHVMRPETRVVMLLDTPDRGQVV